MIFQTVINAKDRDRTVTVWAILLLKDSATYESRGTYGKWVAPPSMEAFQNYEEMQKYKMEKDSRRLIELANPLDDSYIDAYNYHHEGSEKIVVKRGTDSIQSPTIFKFEIEDAKEPDEKTKEIIRIHRGRELQQEMEAQKQRNKSVSRKTKRSAHFTEPHLIRFEVSDAKEPDDATKELIRKSRARELNLTTERIATTTARTSKASIRKMTTKRRRVGRSAQITQPQFIRFELEDAKSPSYNTKEMMHQNKESVNKPDAMLQILNNNSNDTEKPNDSSVQESKRFYYQAVPFKSKRVANSVPIEVQKIIQLMLKDSKTQAQYKHAPNNQDIKYKSLGNVRPIVAGPISAPSNPAVENLVAVYPEPAYVKKIVPIPLPVSTFPVNILSPPPHQEPARQVAYPVEIQAGTGNQQYYHTAAPSQLDPSVYQQPKYLEIVPAITQIIHEHPSAAVAQPHMHEPSLNSIHSNEISNQYPYEKIIPLNPSNYRYGKHLKFVPIPTVQKIENEGLSGGHQQQLVSTTNFNLEHRQIPLNDMQEFRELSALMGKSPEDQINGLAYLLAKEMQRTKRVYAPRPQDNTSPILFHPQPSVGVGTSVNPPQTEGGQNAHIEPPAFPQPIPELPSKDYNSIVENVSQVTYVPQPQSDHTAVVSPPPLPPTPTSYNVVKALGLSPNYKGVDQFADPASIHTDVENNQKLQYAPKYAFGYRVRDFHSGNDFGHKQNRDLDGVTRGQYHILLPDGRVQNVIYHADDSGFHADVSFETVHH